MNPLVLPLAELKPALAGLGKVLPRRPNLPVLGCVRIERRADGRTGLTVTDLDHHLTYSFATPEPPSDPVALLVPFEDLQQVAKSCTAADAITVESSDPQSTLLLHFPLAGQTVEHACSAPPLAEFPQPPVWEAESIPLAEELRTSLLQALGCVSTDATRYVINGAFLDVSRADGHYVVGTDGRHLFSSNSFTLPLSGSLIVPDHRFLGWKGFVQDGAWRLKGPSAKQSVPWFELASEHWCLVARAIDGTYPNWRAVVPDADRAVTRITLAPDTLDALCTSLQRLPCHDEQHHTTVLEVRDGRLQVLGKSHEDRPWTRLDIPGATLHGPGVRIGCDRRLLVKALRFGLNEIQIADATSPLRFCRGGRQMIVMPLRAFATTAAGTQASAPEPAVPPSQPTPEPTKPMPPNPPPIQTHNGSTAPVTAGSNGSNKPALEQALAQIESIKGSLRDTQGRLARLGDTVRQALREQKTSDKDLQAVRQTLRSLQSVKL